MKYIYKCKETIKTMFTPNDKILLAVSGGIDSMVMLDIFHNLYPTEQLAIAHCNFSLRGKDSIKDMEEVIERAAHYNIKLHHIIFDTNKEIIERGITLQETARELRYEWFGQLSEEFGYTKIATAHNKNDNVETFFVNCVRGTGIRGLTGIPISNGLVVRPVLSLTRSDIEQYANRNNVCFRNDKSNSTTKYLRNYIRHEIIPVLKEKSPNFVSVMNSNIEKVRQSVEFINYFVNELSDKYLIKNKDCISLEISKINNYPMGEYLLFEILSKFGFTRSASDSILKSYTNNLSGREFYSKTNKAYLNRGVLEIFTQNDIDIENNIIIPKEDGDYNIGTKTLSLRIVEYTPDIDLKTPKNIAIFDYEKLDDEITIRKWQNGDWFIPFGMSNRKQLSDLFIDSKVSISQKKQIPLMCSGDDIVWVVGLRFDNRYKVSEQTTKILICEYI